MKDNERKPGFYHVVLSGNTRIMRWHNVKWWPLWTIDPLCEGSSEDEDGIIEEIDETPITRGDEKTKRIEELEAEVEHWKDRWEESLKREDFAGQQVIKLSLENRRIQELQNTIMCKDQVIIKQLETISDLIHKKRK